MLDYSPVDIYVDFSENRDSLASICKHFQAPKTQGFN